MRSFPQVEFNLIMASLIHYTSCPTCGAGDFQSVFKVKDNTVSGSYFEVVACSACSLRFTQDVPGPDDISAYYKSENYISHTDSSKGVINRLYKIVRANTLVS